MKVTFCTYDYSDYVGGPNSWLRRLLPGLRQRGIEPSVLSFTFSPEELCPTVRSLRQSGFECTTAPWHQYSEQRVSWILEELAKNPPDVFVPNFIIPAYYAGRWVREAGVPTVGILRGHEDFTRGFLSRFVFGEAEYRVSALVCVSSLLERTILEQNPNEMVVRRIPSGVPVPECVAQAPNGRFRIAYLGRLVEEIKRISEVTRAICRAVREVPDTEGLIYGDGDARPRVEQILREEGKGLPVRLVGWVDNNQIQRHLLECHAVTLLSDHEGLGTALTEGMACGVVPIGLRGPGGVPELIEDGVTGLLVGDRGDEFVAAVRRLRNDTALWQRLANAARAKIEAEYSREICADRWYKLLQELVKEAPSSKRLRIPGRLLLPPVHPAFTWGDERAPKSHAQFMRPFRRFVDRVKCRYSSVFGPR